MYEPHASEQALKHSCSGSSPTWVKVTSVLAPFRATSKTTAGSVPLALVLDEGKAAVQHQPDDLLPGNELGDALLAVVDVLVPVRPLLADLVGPPLDVSRPPAPHVEDRGVRDIGTLVHRERGGVVPVLRGARGRSGSGRRDLFVGHRRPNAAGLGIFGAAGGTDRAEPGPIIRARCPPGSPPAAPCENPRAPSSGFGILTRPGSTSARF